MSETTITPTSNKYEIVQISKTGAQFVIGAKARKDAAIKWATANEGDMVVSPTGKPVWTATPEVAETPEMSNDEGMTATQTETQTAEPIVRERKYATRATTENPNAVTGRFDLATYSKDAGETGYAKRPDAILRALLGIKWVELWDLGITQKVASNVLKEIESGELNLDSYRAECLAALELDEEGAEEGDEEEVEEDEEGAEEEDEEEDEER